MLRSLWTKSLRDRRWAILGWGLGLGGLSFCILLVYPVIVQATGIGDYIEKLPPIFLAILGERDLLSPEGFINAELFHFLIPFVMVSCAIGVSVDVIAGARERGTLELLLAQPLGRTRVVLEGFLATAVLLFTLAFFVWLGLVLGAAHVEVDLAPMKLLGATVAAALVALCFGSFGLLLGSLANRKGPCLAIAGTSVTASFLLHSLGTLVPSMSGVQRLSPFYYYRLGDPVRNGLAWQSAAALLAISLTIVLCTVVVVRRRDVV